MNYLLLKRLCKVSNAITREGGKAVFLLLRMQCLSTDLLLSIFQDKQDNKVAQKGFRREAGTSEPFAHMIARLFGFAKQPRDPFRPQFRLEVAALFRHGHMLLEK